MTENVFPLPAYAEITAFPSPFKTKSNIFNGYVLMSMENWEEANNYIKKSIENYSKVLNNIDNPENNHKFNKIYVILNELQNATEIKNKEVFLIKYKNFLEETQNKKFK